MNQIFYSSKLKKNLRRMPDFVKKAFLEKESLFLTDVFHSSLETPSFMENTKNIGLLPLLASTELCSSL